MVFLFLKKNYNELNEDIVVLQRIKKLLMFYSKIMCNIAPFFR